VLMVFVVMLLGCRCRLLVMMNFDWRRSRLWGRRTHQAKPSTQRKTDICSLAGASDVRTSGPMERKFA
jgi:hypothetical protein